MSTVDSMWFTTYCALALEWDYPILEAVGAYWRYLTHEVDYICASSQVGVLVRYLASALHTDPALILALLARKGAMLQYIPENRRTPDMYLAAGQ